jgi:soluble lytic murein transglycosylase
MASWLKHWPSTTRNSWARITRGRWFPNAGVVVAALILIARFASSAQTLEANSLEAVARAFRDKPGPVTRAALEKHLLRHPKDVEGALARLVLFNGDTSTGAVEKILAARPYLAEISDYVDWIAASTAFAAKDYEAALAGCERVLAVAETPLAARAAVLALKSAQQLNQVDKIDALLARHSRVLTAAQTALYGGIVAQQRSADSVARRNFVTVLTEWPRTVEATEAAGYLTIGQLTPTERLARANKLLDQGDPGAARAEFVALLPRLEGKNADLARVRIGVCDYRLRKPTALSALNETNVTTPEADAERLFYALLAARRAKSYDAMGVAMRELSEKYPKSSFRLEGLANAASQFWVLGDHTRSLPLYEACAADFGNRPEGKDCEWKVAVQSFILNRPGADKKLEAFLRNDPGGEHASAALYFLGRAAENRRDKAAAKAYFERAIAVFPNHFYAELCRDRITQAGLQSVAAAPAVETSLRQMNFPAESVHLSFEANAATRRRMSRANLLARGALYDFAELELRHEARGSEQAHLLALAAAKMATRRGAPEQGIRYVKSIFPSYLNLPINAATLPLLRLAYPLPYKDPLWTYSFKHEIDPYLLAGLIRQESEFNAKVVSRANAHGLTQIMPATGRELARRLGIKGFTSKMLFEPAVNLQMGSFYLKSLIDSLGGNLAQALASYNAGKGRVTEWLGRGEYRDPAEFVESIPFNETRGYVQSVLRNAGIYRRLYGNDAAIVPAPVLPSGNGDPNAAKRRPAN